MVIARVAPRPRIVPDIYPLLSQWRYVEESVLRILAGWGRCAEDWEDKLAVCYHVWLQAEIVHAMRQRLAMYPGGKPDPTVHVDLQHAMDQVILAPSWPGAMAGVHQAVNETLTQAYTSYIAASHPVHDRPTFDLLHRVLELKRIQRKWYEGFQQRHPHTPTPQWWNKVQGALHQAGRFTTVLEPVIEAAMPCGKMTTFRMPQTPGRVRNWNLAPSIMPMIELDWSTSVETRRLFFMLGYCWEMGVAEAQLRWIYHADFMPWEFIYAEARHMWDESRHGDSGYHRLRDFGFNFEHFGYSSYGATGEGVLEPMTPRDVYEAFYGVTQIAETGYFETKRYCFEDFQACRDDASAQMMQFDIIDETSHVEYGRIWLDEMAARAGVQEDYRKRGATDRSQARLKAEQRVAGYRAAMEGNTIATAESPRHGGDSVNPGFHAPVDALRNEVAWKHYQWMLSEIKGQCPLKAVDDVPARPFLPM
ncbi:MAG: hypothetical protein IT440_08925 [Phycisphaeraceae bacterium]|nr:hypothetical protein [Phycisphaeraceae bacterium]